MTPHLTTSADVDHREVQAKEISVTHVSDRELLELVRRLMKFPYPQICRHYVAGMILDLLEKNGYPLTQELAEAVVRADDDRALALLSDPTS